GLQAVYATCVIDTTGDGDVCAYAGCAYEFGDEEGGLAAASLEMQVENVDDADLMDYMRQTGDVRFRKIIGELIEQGIWKFPYTIFISVLLTKPGVYMINTIRQVGINGINAESLTAGTIDGRAENLALLDIMRAYFPGFAHAEVRQIAQSIGIRETRRIVGDYTLTVQDLIDGTQFPDSIAVSAYHWDLPDPKSPSHQPYEGVTRKSPYTPIPYRCLLPQGVTGLLAAGRCISVEREVLGPVRVMGPCLAMGEAAGIAAAMALEYGGNFRKVDVDLLKRRVEEYGGITEMP
ncbi:MAG: FAD-dependent oxidoreductase, partial [Clostridia bacterium]|nr:FAD-dependent oxidoreductase [Clostridia bacterium]